MFTEIKSLLMLNRKIENHYEFKYQGDSHYIDINTLLASQFHFSAIVNEIKNQIHSDVELKLKVKSFEKGSFDVNQLFEISAISGLFVLENIDYVANIFSVMSDYISIKNFLGDKKADSTITDGSNVEIHLKIEGNNNTLTISEKAFEIYKNNIVISEALKQDCKVLESDEEIDGIQITNTKNNKKVVEVKRDEFKNLAKSNPYLDDEEQEKIQQSMLGILRWETIPKKNSKWSFIYDNRKINQVAIKDEIFLKRVVDEKLRFGAGDSLFVDLLIKLKKDDYSGMYLEDKFEIIKVHDINWRDEQTSLF